MDIFNVNSIKLIQNIFRIYRCKKSLNNFLSIKLENEINKPYYHFKKIMMKNDVINKSKHFCNLLEKYKKNQSINSKILISSYLIHYYPNDIIGKQKERTQYDNNLINNSSLVINSLKSKNIKNIWYVLNNFANEFKKWAEIDKNKMIEKLIISFYYHMEHINKINSGEISQNIDINQKKEIIDYLEKECNNIKKTIKLMDKNFDINYLENNYILLYKNIIEGLEKIRTNITYNMINAYYNTLCDDIKTGSNILILNEIEQICKRLFFYIPANKKEYYSNFFTNENILSLLIENDYTDDLINFIDMLVDLVISLDSPSNNIINNHWKLSIKELTKNNYTDNFPKILIEINQHIDIIVLYK